MKVSKILLLSIVVNAIRVPTFHSTIDKQRNVEISNFHIPSMDDGAKVARTLVHRESMMNINTIGQEGHAKGVPTSSIEYYVDCDGDGDPYWLVVDIGSPYRHIAKGSPFSATIRVGDHHPDDDVSSEYPGAVILSPMGSPRVNLMGELQDVSYDPRTLLRLRKCFLERHPDAKWWLPLNLVLPHKTHWTKFVVKEVYMVGGFGDRAYIGTIDGESYHKASVIEKVD